MTATGMTMTKVKIKTAKQLQEGFNEDFKKLLDPTGQSTLDPNLTEWDKAILVGRLRQTLSEMVDRGIPTELPEYLKGAPK